MSELVRRLSPLTFRRGAAADCRVAGRPATTGTDRRALGEAGTDAPDASVLGEAEPRFIEDCRAQLAPAVESFSQFTAQFSASARSRTPPEHGSSG